LLTSTDSATDDTVGVATRAATMIAAVTCDKEAVKEGGETQDKSEGCVGELVFIGIGKLVDLVAWISRKTAYLATGAAKTAFPELAPVWINIAAVGKGIETAASVVS